MLTVYLYGGLCVCGLILAIGSTNPVSRIAGVGMAVLGGVAAIQQYRRVKKGDANPS